MKNRAFFIDFVPVLTGSGKSGNRRRTEEEWKPIFEAALNSSDWILEDTGRLIFSEGLKRAEKIALLELPPLVIRFRLVRRYLRQKLGLESCAYPLRHHQ